MILTMALAIITGGCFAQSTQKRKTTVKKAQTTQTVKATRRATAEETEAKPTDEELNEMLKQKNAQDQQRDSIAREEIKKMEQQKRQTAKKK